MTDLSRYDGRLPEPPYVAECSGCMALSEDCAAQSREIAYLTTDRDRLRAENEAMRNRLEVSDDPEMSPDRIAHLEGLLDLEQRCAQKTRAELDAMRRELERVKRSHLRRMIQVLESILWRPSPIDRPKSDPIKWHTRKQLWDRLRAALSRMDTPSA